MADWQEVVQASVIALIFAFMVAKLMSVVISFRGENLRVERGKPDVSDISEGEELLGESGSSSDEEEDQNLSEIEQSKFEKGSIEDEREETDLAVERVTDTKAMQPRSVDTDLHSLMEEKSDRKDSVEAALLPDDVVAEKLESEEDIVHKEESEVSDAKENEEEGQKVKKAGEAVGEVELPDSDEWEGVESSELEELFGAAATFVATQAVGPGLKVSNETQLLLYGLYKLATEGPCSTPQPSAYKMSARAKWNAWQKLGNIGPEEAMNRYIAVVSEMSPTWSKGLPQAGEEQAQSSTDADAVQRGGMGGPVFSSLVMNEEGGEEEGTLEAIHVCAREGDQAGLTQQLESGTAADLKDSDGRTALHWAADRGHLHAVELLLAKGAEIHSKDLEGQTALHYAATCEQEEIAKYLISKGADPAMADNDGVTPLSSCPAQWLWMKGTT